MTGCGAEGNASEATSAVDPLEPLEPLEHSTGDEITKCWKLLLDCLFSQQSTFCKCWNKTKGEKQAGAELCQDQIQVDIG